MSSFRNKKYSNSTELSKKILTLKDDNIKNIKHAVSWKAVQTTSAGQSSIQISSTTQFEFLGGGK